MRLSLPSLLTLTTAGALLALALWPAPQPVAATTLAAGDGGCRVTRVIDGDTVDMACPGTGVFRARLIGYDTPETRGARCPAEAALGDAATARLRMLLAQAGRLDARAEGLDRYGRTRVALTLDGRDVGRTLIAEGLAVAYRRGEGRIDWCARLR